MACKKAYYQFRQGSVQNLEFGWSVDDQYLDLSGDTGVALFLVDGVALYSFPLDLTFVDVNTKNIHLPLTNVQTASIDPGKYTLLLKITRPDGDYYRPKEGTGFIQVTVKSSL